MTKQWIGVELDGTLAEVDKLSGDHIGEALPRMVSLVKDWLDAGKPVKILTTRNVTGSSLLRIKSWLSDNGLGGLDVVALDADMGTLWSARAVRVEHNTGKPCRACADAPVQRHSTHVMGGGFLAPRLGYTDQRFHLTDC
ncbi:hypothetical protein [Chitinimonas sp. JJ19]|uniref:hypothetical protein n=1 Tax=Chitinimonas sp. JJ19 TaxID=3109352 RepID=UPI0030033D3F